MKMSELDRMIRKIVQEEFKTSAKKYITAYVPVVIKEVVDELVEKRLAEIIEIRSSSKKLSLKEQITNELDNQWNGVEEEEVKSISKSKMSSLVSRGGDMARGPVNLIEHMITEQGTAVPIDPTTIPQSVVTALNKDYRKFLKAVDEHKGAGTAIPLGMPIERGGY